MSDQSIGWFPVCNGPRIEVGTGCECCFNHLLRITNPDEVEQLQARNAELAAEVERWKTISVCEACAELPAVFQYIEGMEKQLAIAEEHAMRLREALENHSGNYKLSKAECAVINDLLDKPASREALDAYVANKIEEYEKAKLYNVRKM